MRNWRASVFLAVAAAAASLAWAQPPEQQPEQAGDPAAEAELLTGVRQLTFEGRRAGEGYFSGDGSQMVFQSERAPGNPFFQIYLMDLTTGDVTRVSPGHGKTTCAWIHPDGDQVLFASTQDDPQAKQKQREELELRASGKQRRYSWDYDEHYDLTVWDRDTGEYRNLTDAPGYDAEGSWSPDGSRIVFASNRRAYSEELTEREREHFEIDPAYMIDLYIMDADGGNVRRLTDTPGYDGGPFFSPDGSRICWRRFSTDGATAEVMTMNVDGSDVRQLTKLGAMSWAPYYHPSGRYLIFTTNRHGFSNFELYLVDAEGRREPVRVTHTEGFDGLPVFTPDGRQLAWTSARTSSKRSQIFLGKWDHQRALELLELDEQEDSPQARAAAAETLKQATPEYSETDILRHVDYLCREELEGRMTGTPGERLATAYVAAAFDSFGLRPGGGDGKWYQPFDFTAGVDLGADNRLTDNGQPLELDEDWRPVAFSETGEFEPAGVVFAGYGIKCPQAEKQPEYDSFVHLDVKDKWVLCLRFMPEGVTPERRQHLARHASLRYKTMQVRDLGARGLIIASGPQSKVRNQLVPLQFDGSLTGTSIPVLSVSDAVAARWLKRQGKSLAELQKKLDTGEAMMGLPLEETKVGGQIDIQHVRRTGRNVLGWLRADADGRPTEQAIVVGAHIDHLGRGNSGSLAKDDERGQIHYGADDNASGVASVLEIAQHLADQQRQGKLKLKRDILFAAWSGEELGLIGSNHFVNNFPSPHGHGHGHASGHGPAAKNGHGEQGEKRPADTKHAPAEDPHGDDKPSQADKPAKDKPAKDKPAKDKPAKDKSGKPDHAAAARDPHADPHSHAPSGIYPRLAACLNLDMVGRLSDKLVLQGIGSSSVWRSEIERRNVPVGLPLTLQEDSHLPTDASSFYMQGVPILSAFTGSHDQYHTPRDTPDRLNYEGTARVARLMGLIARSLAMRDEAPDYIEQAAPRDGQRAALRAYLGTIPDYAQADIKGVKLSGVSKGGPAAKAGLQSGDVIVELAGRKIENIYDYTYAIEALKIGEEVKIIVRRGKKRVKLEITPGSRQ